MSLYLEFLYGFWVLNIGFYVYIEKYFIDWVSFLVIKRKFWKKLRKRKCYFKGDLGKDL